MKINKVEFAKSLEGLSYDTLQERFFHLVVNFGETNTFREELPIYTKEFQRRFDWGTSEMESYVRATLTIEVLTHYKEYSQGDEEFMHNFTASGQVEEWMECWRNTLVEPEPDFKLLCEEAVKDLERVISERDALQKELEMYKSECMELNRKQLDWITEAVKFGIKEANRDDRAVNLELQGNEISAEINEDFLLDSIMNSIEEENEG